MVEFNLIDNNKWGKIEDFTLNIIKGDKKELVSLCFPGDVKLVNDTVLQAHMENFNPDSNLNIYFSNIHIPLDNSLGREWQPVMK